MSQSEEARKFIEQARQRIRTHAQKRRHAGQTDKLYAVVQSKTGNLYVGIPLETSMPQANFCAERHAINNMLYTEPDSGAVERILVATPAPDETTNPTTPCGACRHVIHQFSNDATIYCATFVRETDGWTMFPRVDEYSAKDMYPNHHGHPSWD
ncbi:MULTISPECIES: cytidine/deoxycytidylate deaminase family protein [Halolamina]|uniref:hypothetical protein n=1 Tax=Halolamina TaxID=1075397 RepID=UPI0011604221|nr:MULTISPECIES: hypothetical protein [Halolamina]NHX37638.1 hypothetical protein [Halolamina sp. R1-12]